MSLFQAHDHLTIHVPEATWETSSGRVKTVPREIVLEVESTDSVDRVKRKVQEKCGIPHDQHDLWLENSQLESKRSLSSYDLKVESYVRLVQRKKPTNTADWEEDAGVFENEFRIRVRFPGHALRDYFLTDRRDPRVVVRRLMEDILQTRTEMTHCSFHLRSNGAW